ncbi:hypothetical protein KG892_02775 [Vermiphilus pyriformis]|uniref:Uncharacterized protein n=1 Tax=candidate division TM6 bacterium JCVI TM6SC1 TaxID=1306947 RepID=A0A0D2JM50_9BACT|nr:hypothetical protein J120_00455 [candidate division TM6 bacterium JCVI TM6SC1]UNE35921.1 MAG: hypothetical protein KG892_02775 [Vermiphilus pyriformis]
MKTLTVWTLITYIPLAVCAEHKKTINPPINVQQITSNARSHLPYNSYAQPVYKSPGKGGLRVITNQDGEIIDLRTPLTSGAYTPRTLQIVNAGRLTKIFKTFWIWLHCQGCCSETQDSIV